MRFVQSIGRGERSADSVPDTLPPDLDRTDPGPVDEPADDAVPQPSGPALAARDLHRLRSALAELRECNRVLSALKAAAEAGGEMVNGD